MRKQFDEQLALMNRQLTNMGSMCGEVISLAAKALTLGNTKMAAEVAPLDSEIDSMEHTIETLCLRLLLQQQPVASDLRQISAALKMITDMERIGDQADDIAELVGVLGGSLHEHFHYINEMADAVIKMVNDSVSAFIRKDTELATAVIRDDDNVDGLFMQVKKALIEHIVSNPTEGEEVLDLLMIAKYFERIGDHATNIAEWVVFSVTGEHKEGNEKHGLEYHNTIE